MTDGKYKLRIVTQFSKGVTLLKSPRTIEYKLPLTVGAGGGDSESRMRFDPGEVSSLAQGRHHP